MSNGNLGIEDSLGQPINDPTFVERALNAFAEGAELTPAEYLVLLTAAELQIMHGVVVFPKGLSEFNVAVEDVRAGHPLEAVVATYTDSQTPPFIGDRRMEETDPLGEDLITPDIHYREPTVHQNSRDNKKWFKIPPQVRYTKPSQSKLLRALQIGEGYTDDGTPLPRTIDLLTEEMGFDRDDIIYMVAAYGNRVVPVGEEEVDLLKLATWEFRDKNKGRHGKNNAKRRMWTDFICYLEVLSSTWSNSGTSVANRFIQAGDSASLFKVAKDHYDTLSSILNDSRTSIRDPNFITSLRSATYLFERYVLRKDVIPPVMVLVYGDLSIPTLGDVMPPKLK